uniref:Uncharacterized protein n=1 Tax=Manihot esculenta TaxID=3983 RepID=A0A2C9WQK9_MANES
MFLASDVILAVVIITSPSSTCYCQVLVYFILFSKQNLLIGSDLLMDLV